MSTPQSNGGEMVEYQCTGYNDKGCGNRYRSKFGGGLCYPCSFDRKIAKLQDEIEVLEFQKSQALRKMK